MYCLLFSFRGQTDAVITVSQDSNKLSWSFPTALCIILTFVVPPGFQKEEVLRPLDVSVPIWALAHGPRASVYHQRHHRTLPEDERTSGMSASSTCVFSFFFF